MIARHRPLLAILAIAAILQLVGMVRSPLPSQDGLKFIRIAREFGRQPWLDVVRSADQHPLYPLLIAAGQPVVSTVIGDGPASWRVTAQGVSTLATLAMIPCAFIFSSVLVDRRSALLAALLLALLPTAARLGHETLSDATAFGFAVASLALGCRATTTGRVLPALGSGLLAGLGFLARPEVALVPVAIAAGWIIHQVFDQNQSTGTSPKSRTRKVKDHTDPGSTTRRVVIHYSPSETQLPDRHAPVRLPSAPHVRTQSPNRSRAVAASPRAEVLALTEHPEGSSNSSRPENVRHSKPAPSSPLLSLSKTLRAILLPPLLLLVPLLTIVSSYAIIKGSLSEKLSVRFATGLGDSAGLARSAPPWMPAGLDDPRWDFSPKEEAAAPGRLNLAPASLLTARRIAEATAWVLIPLAVLGSWTQRAAPRSRPARLATGLLAIGFAAILVRHTMNTGYLSDRHCLLIVIALLPFSSLGAITLARTIADRREIIPSRRQKFTLAILFLLTLAGVAPHFKTGHPSRWGHHQAGIWIAQQARPGEAVLDTRGWAAFSSGLRSYGPWHIRQAISDAKLGYIVITDDELSAGTRRAETFAALLEFAAEPVAAFPEREGGSRIGVRVFRFTRPESWEGINR